MCFKQNTLNQKFGNFSPFLYNSFLSNIFDNSKFVENFTKTYIASQRDREQEEENSSKTCITYSSQKIHIVLIIQQMCLFPYIDMLHIIVSDFKFLS